MDYLTKPYHRDELLARVRTHLELQQLRHHLEPGSRRAQKLELVVLAHYDALTGLCRHPDHHQIGNRRPPPPPAPRATGERRVPPPDVPPVARQATHQRGPCARQSQREFPRALRLANSASATPWKSSPPMA